MEPFRSTRGGGVRARLGADEASLLRSLVGQVLALIAPDDPEDPEDPYRPDGAPVPPDAAGSPAAEEIAALEAQFRLAAPKTPEDPVLARLLPDGYRDDPDAAGEFRKYTEPALRSAKQQAAQQMLDSLPEAGGRIQLTPEQAQAWLKALNDVRLALGVRLDVTEDFEQQWARLDAADPRWAAYEVYAWLGAVQESLVQALR
jgi:Lon protease-like protein